MPVEKEWFDKNLDKLLYCLMQSFSLEERKAESAAVAAASNPVTKKIFEFYFLIVITLYSFFNFFLFIFS